MIPVAGSAYTYAYATLGELFAWIIGWDLVLEYALGAATIAVGWSGNFISILQDIGDSLSGGAERRRQARSSRSPTASTVTRRVQPAGRGDRAARVGHPRRRHPRIGRVQLRRSSS